MAELLILLAFQHKASRLEYRTIDGEFRVAEIIDELAYEFPTPPECARDPIFKHLQSIFDLSSGAAKQQRLKVRASLAVARCDIAADYQNATITVVHPFTPSTDLGPELRRFWRTRAASQGCFALLKFYIQQFMWKIEGLANQAVNRSRR